MLLDVENKCTGYHVRKKLIKHKCNRIKLQKENKEKIGDMRIN